MSDPKHCECNNKCVIVGTSDCPRVVNANYIANLKAEVARLRRVLGEISQWRESAWDYDDDMDHERRSFSDDEEWDMVEKHARISIEEVKK